MFNIKDLPTIERKSDGFLPRMSPRQRTQANALIRRECSYYDDGNCLYLDRGEEVVCPQSITYSVCCKFFRHIVLEGKEGKTLKAALFQKEALRRCMVCGGAFSSTSNNAKYCEGCKGEVQRKQKAAYARKRRAGVEKQSLKKPVISMLSRHKIHIGSIFSLKAPEMGFFHSTQPANKKSIAEAEKQAKEK